MLSVLKWARAQGAKLKVEARAFETPKITCALARWGSELIFLEFSFPERHWLFSRATKHWPLNGRKIWSLASWKAYNFQLPFFFPLPLICLQDRINSKPAELLPQTPPKSHVSCLCSELLVSGKHFHLPDYICHKKFSCSFHVLSILAKTEQASHGRVGWGGTTHKCYPHISTTTHLILSSASLLF